MISLSVEGQAALASRFAAMPSAVQAAVLAKASQLAEALKAHVVQDKLSGQVLQTKTGALRDSIEAEVVADGTQVSVRLYSTGEVRYAAIQEYGGHTPAHDIVPNKGKALAFLAGGRRVFAKIVHHPGSTIPARPFMGPALNDMAAQIAEELKAAALAAANG